MGQKMKDSWTKERKAKQSKRVKDWFTKERRAEWSKKNMGENNPMYGTSRTEKQKIKQSKKMKGKMSGKNNPMYGKKSLGNPGGRPRITKICEYCKEKYPVKPSRVNSSHYCSRPCQNKAQGIKHRGEGSPRYNRIKRICSWCGKDKWVIPSQKRTNYFCNGKCYGNWRAKNIRGDKVSNWNNGSSFIPYGLEWTDLLKREIRNWDLHRCQFCGKTEKANGRILDVHHIDGNPENCDPINLISLCINCHTRTRSHRDQWKSIFKALLLSRNRLNSSAFYLQKSA